jgi:hypothetical protein
MGSINGIIVKKRHLLYISNYWNCTVLDFTGGAVSLLKFCLLSFNVKWAVLGPLSSRNKAGVESLSHLFNRSDIVFDFISP